MQAYLSKVAINRFNICNNNKNQHDIRLFASMHPS